MRSSQVFCVDLIGKDGIYRRVFLQRHDRGAVKSCDFVLVNFPCPMQAWSVIFICITLTLCEVQICQLDWNGDVLEYGWKENI